MSGTTSDKLQGIVNSKEAIRQAIASKGQECSTSTKLADYAGKISGIETQYYKCASLTPASSGGVIVSGAGSSSCNGTYTIQDATATGQNRVWVNGDFQVQFGVGGWRIRDTANEETYYWEDLEESTTTSPWEATWTYAAGSTPVPTVAEGQPTAASWNGYLASVNATTGVWTFASEATTGLTYDKLTPTVGFVYDAAATLKATDYYTGIPTDGLVFYAPLEESKDTAETGQSLTSRGVGGLTFTTVKGIPCMQGWAYGGLKTNFGLSAASSYTYSFWYHCGEAASPAFGYNVGAGSAVSIDPDSGKVVTGYNGTSSEMPSYTANAWHHICVTFGSGTVTVYIDGVSSKNWSSTIPSITSTDSSCSFWAKYGSTEAQTICFSHARVYSRALAASEVAALAAELTPTA